MGAAIFGVALFLRLSSIDFGLRHEPHYDERIFVDNALGMRSRGDWDHRFYEYPGLLLWMFRAVLSGGASDAGAYLMCRQFVALLSASTVPLLFAVVLRSVSFPSAVFASLLLTLSPVDVETAHMIRPDAALAPFLLLALVLAAPREGQAREWVAWSVATIGLAIKFSAALIFAPLICAAWLARVSIGRMLALATGSFLLFCLLSPYTLLAGSDSFAGMGTQIAYHYEQEQRGASLWRNVLGFLTETLPSALPIPALVVVGLGVIRVARERSARAAVWLMFPLLWIGVFSTTGVRFGRFVVPILGTLCLISALGFDALFRRSRIAAAIAAFASLLPAASATADYLIAIGTPSTADRALDWAGQSPEIEAVGSTVLELGFLDRDSVEVTPLPGFQAGPFVARRFDALIVKDPAPDIAGCEVAARFAPASIHSGPGLAALRCARVRTIPLDLRAARLQSSAENREDRLVDGQISTRWRADTPIASIRLAWPVEVSPSEIEFLYGGNPPDRDLGLRLSDDQGPLTIDSLRPPLGRQHLSSLGFSQRFAWPARATRSLRLEISGPAPIRIGELMVLADVPPER